MEENRLSHSMRTWNPQEPDSPAPPPEKGQNGNNDKDEEAVEDEEGEMMMMMMSGRERLKRHREEVKGRVNIPEDWGQERLLKDWIDCTAFDALIAPHTLIVSARDALAADARKPQQPRTSHRILRIHTSC